MSLREFKNEMAEIDSVTSAEVTDDDQVVIHIFGNQANYFDRISEIRSRYDIKQVDREDNNDTSILTYEER